LPAALADPFTMGIRVAGASGGGLLRDGAVQGLEPTMVARPQPLTQ
jgi:hypothetical protein